MAQVWSSLPTVLALGLLLLAPALLRWSVATAFSLVAPGRRRAPAGLGYPLSYECSQCRQSLRWYVSVCPECDHLRLWPIGMAAVEASFVGGAATVLQRSGPPGQLWWLPYAGAAVCILAFAVMGLEIARVVGRAIGQRRRTRREVEDFLAGRESIDQTERDGLGAGRVLAIIFVLALASIASVMMLLTLPTATILVAAMTGLIKFATQKSTSVRASPDAVGSVRRLDHAQFAQWVSATLEYGASRQYSRLLLNPAAPVPVKWQLQGAQRRAWGHVNAWWTSPVILAAVIGVLLPARYSALFESGPTWPAAIVLGGFIGGAYGRFWRWQRTPRLPPVRLRW
jgi:hypothetical protein